MGFYANYPPSASGGGSASTGINNTPIPGSATLIGGSDGTNLRPVSVDTTGKLNINNISGTITLPTGAATAAKQPALGTAGVASTDVITVQGIAGGVAQPVSGTVTANQGTANTVANAWTAKITDGTNTSAVKAASTAPVATDPALVVSMSPNSADPTLGTVGAGTAGTKSQLSGGVFNTVLPTLTNGQQSAVQLDSSGRVITRPLTSTDTVTVVQPTGTNLNAVVSQATAANLNATVIQATASSLNATVVQGTASNLKASVNLNDGAGTSVTVGQKVMASSLPVAIASDQGAMPVSQSGTWTVQPGNTANTTPWLTAETTSSTSNVTQITSSATNVTFLSSNVSRKQAAFYNNSTQILYLKLGATASASSFTVAIPASAYYELPNGKIYNGQVDGFWASANGSALVTELT